MILRRHYAAFILAVVMGALVAVPPLIAIHAMGPLYQGVRPVVVDDGLYYLARAHETIDGHPTLGNPYLAEHKGTPGVQFWIADTVLARISLFFFGNLGQGGVFWDFLLPFLDTLATYAIFYALTRRRSAAIVLSGFLILGLFFLPLNRTPYPQLLVLLLLPIYALVRMEGARWRAWALTAAILGGILFYVYPFFWTTWVVVVAVAAILALLFERARVDWWRYGLILLGSIVIGIPYFLGNLAASRLPYYAESLARIGVIHTHFPSGIEVVATACITLLFFVVAWWQKIITPTRLTLLALSGSLAGAIVMNQHVITGLNFQFVVHYTLPSMFLSIFALAYLGAAYFDTVRFARYERVALPLLYVVLIIATLWMLVPQVVHISTPQASDIEAQRYGPVLRWLDANTQTDAVVYADDALSLYVPAYTRDDVYFSMYVFNTYLSQGEVEARYLGSRYFDGPLTRSDIIADETEVFGAPYVGQWQHTQMINKVRALFGLRPLIVEQYPEALIAQLITQEAALQKGTFKAALDGWPADYLVWDTLRDPQWNLARVPGLSELYAANGLIVYKLPQ